MASSDDETEIGPQSVSNYHFVDDDDAPTSFSVLPLQWGKSECVNEKINEQIFVHGSVDNGLQTIHKEVIAWKFDLLNANPEISVLTKENNWIKLEKPRKSFEEIIRTVLITVQCLHFARRNPDTSEKSIWDHLSKVFSSYEVRPSQNHLVDHLDLISEAVKQDKSLEKSKFLQAFLKKKPKKRKLPDEDAKPTTMSGFIVDDMEDELLEDNEEDEPDKDVCAICDNGGDLLCCDGSCMRSFHATVDDCTESKCASLGLSRRQVDATTNFYCKNCEYKQHQCFACGELGSSDKSSGAEVFQCASATCGYFYHPHCVAKLLLEDDEVAAVELEKNIIAGPGFFICPLHKCCVCKKGENKKIEELQFAVCRRCPTSYHRKCLPREIAFEKKVGGGGEEEQEQEQEQEQEEEEEDEDEDVETRAWEDLLPGRVLIYCLKHEIIDWLATPIRDIRFPDVEEKRKKLIPELPRSSGEVLSKKRRLISEDSSSETFVVEEHREPSFGMKKVANVKKSENIPSGLNTSTKVKETDAYRKPFKESAKSVTSEVNRSGTATVNKTSLGDRLYALMTNMPEVNLGKQDKLASEPDKSMVPKSSAKKSSIELSTLDADSEKRILAIMTEAESSITVDEIFKKHEVISTHSYPLKSVVDKTITAGKVEGAIKAIRTALKKLEDGCTPEDARDVCEPEVLTQVFRWKNKLSVYLAPFLRGKRYTSFGRHFTKREKLEKIVDILHWYVRDGDMIVDFCCGANDFSCLMKKKVEETEKKCSYKNYDLFQPKNDFNFEKRDWMTVSPNELPKRGSQLIMGLNPPFGVKAALANKFIDKALKFKPKLLILIVPPETESLDKKNPPYDLVWEDDQCLSGKSFYLPGSIDENDKQMDQWNLISPPLYLWSRRDWTARHKAIAKKHGHVSRQQGGSSLEKGDASELVDDNHMQNKELNSELYVAEGHGECSHRDNGVRENQGSHDTERNRSKETSRKRKHGEDKLDRGTNEKLREKTRDVRKSSGINSNDGTPRHVSPKLVNGRSSQEGCTSRSHELHLPEEAVENRLSNSEPGISGSHMPYGRAYGGSRTNIHDDAGKHYSMNYDENTHGIHGFSHSNMEEQYSVAMRESVGSVAHRSYHMEFEREPDVLLQVRRNGQDPDSYMHRNYDGGRYPVYGQMGPAATTPYGHLGTGAAESSYRMNMSATQRYAPRLDELNHPMMMNNFGPDPSMMTRTGMYNSQQPSDPSMMGRNGMYNSQQPPPGYDANSVGFAPGPHHPYSYHNSAGWLNE